MEDPGDALTSIHCIDGIGSVQWTSFVAGPERAYHNEARPSDDCYEALQATELELRARGCHVFLEATQGALFLFELPSSAITSGPPRKRQAEDIDTVIEAHGLTKEASGGLKANDLSFEVDSSNENSSLGKRKRSVDNKSLSLGNADRTAIDQNLLVDLESRHFDVTEEPHDLREVSSIRVTLMRALASSLVQSIKQKRSYLPLGPCHFIWPLPADVSDAINDQGADLRPATRKLELFSIGIFWQSDGSLLLGSYKINELWPLTLSDTDIGSKVVLAPFGWQGFVVEVGDHSDMSPTKKDHKSKSSLHYSHRQMCSSLLKRHGIKLSPDLEWVSIQLSNSKLAIFGNGNRVLWPALLCFDIYNKSFGRADDCLDFLGGLARIHDPLADAEEWFLNESDRARKIAEQLQVKPQLRELDNAESSEDEVVPEGLQTRSDDQLELQALAGIYPTPPDGFKPQGSTPMMDRMTVPTGKVDDDEHMIDNAEQAAEPDPMLSNEIELGTYRHLDDDDLFGDVGEQMYANNGITEDDFDFFDEPDEIRNETDDRKSSPEVHQASQEPESSQLFDDINRSSPPLRAPTKCSPENESKRDLTFEDSEIPNGNGPESDTGNLEMQHSAITSQSPEMSSELSPSRPSSLQYHMDDKYTEIGKFASLHSKYPATAKPAAAPIVKSAIPILHNHPLSALQDSERNIDQSSPSFDSPQTENSETPTSNYSLENVHNETANKKSPIANDFTETTFWRRPGILSTSLPSPPGSSPMSSVFQNQEFETGRLSNLTELPLKQEFGGHDDWTDRLIQLAQIIADQAVHYKSLCQIKELRQQTTDASRQHYSFDPLAEAVAQTFPERRTYRLHDCASIKAEKSQVDMSSQSTTPSASKQMYLGKAALKPADASEESTILLPVPDFRVKRGETTLDISSTALDFWKELGLSPSHGPKDVIAFCVHPDSSMFRRGAENFIDSIGQTYLSLRLGSHISGHPALKKYASGLVAFSVSMVAQETWNGLEDVCEVLGKSLSALAALEKTIVIYMVDPTNGQSSIRRTCELFQKIFEAYASAVRMANNPCDLVTQLVPLDWIGSSSRVAILSLRQCTRLANLVYDRCPPADPTSSAYSAASLFELAKPLPKALHFKLSSAHSSDPLQNAKVIYLGYCWNDRSRWLSAAFIDSTGSQQWSASYCIGQLSNQWSSFELIAQEIWAVIEEAFHVSQDDCRILVSKTGPLHPIERETWTNLCHQSDVGVSFVIADERLPIWLLDKRPHATANELEQEYLAMPDTPDVAYGDQSGPKFLEEQDSSTRLIKYHAQKWGMVSTSILNAVNGFKVEGAMASGYIVGADKSLIGIYLVDSTKGENFKEILCTFHRLTVLAQARGIETAIPWHLAVPKLAHAELEVAMEDTGRT